MIRGIIYHHDFWIEVQEAAAFLSARGAESAGCFGQELVTLVETVFARPMSFRSIHGPTRRALLRAFNYQLVFEVDAAALCIVGLMHGSRDFRRWLRAKQKSG